MTTKTILHQLFRFGLLIKGITGILGLLSGIIILITKSNFLLNILQTVLEKELLHDPQDYVANQIYTLTQQISQGALYLIAIYLIIHGIINLIIFIGLWWNKKWAYPASTIILSLFILYQLGKFARTHSISILIFIIIDLGILFLLHSEYKKKPTSQKTLNNQ